VDINTQGKYDFLCTSYYHPEGVTMDISMKILAEEIDKNVITLSHKSIRSDN